MEKENKKSELPPCIDTAKCRECLFRTLCMDEEELQMVQAMRDCSK